MSRRGRHEAVGGGAGKGAGNGPPPGLSLDLGAADPPLVIVVGSGGVGKTTLAASMGLASADAGIDTLVMTFDPSLRLKDALGVGEARSDGEVDDGEIEVVAGGDGRGSLHASLLDAGKTFDRLVDRYAPNAAARDRILGNPYYGHLSSHLGGILEYMAVERLYEVAQEGRYQRIILDTPPTSQAIDFLEAPGRVISFLESGALKIALRPWFGEDGRLKVTSKLRFVGRGVESFLDRIVGMDLLRDMSEFFLAFEPLFEGFEGRARKVESLLADADSRFLLVTGPGESRIPDTLFFARRLKEAGYGLGPLVVNRVHPTFDGVAAGSDAGGAAGQEGIELFRWLGDSHRRGLEALGRLLPDDQRVVPLAVEADEPTDLDSLLAMGVHLRRLLAGEESAS